MKILQRLRHKNVVRLLDIVVKKKPLPSSAAEPFEPSIFLVMEHADCDLEQLLRRQHRKLAVPLVRRLMRDLMSGLAYCHAHAVVHRDVKPSDLRIAHDGKIKLTDFDLSRETVSAGGVPARQLTNRVVTLWYRAPELLLGSHVYGAAVDMWSAGCVVADALLGSPLFRSSTELECLDRIARLCGTPTQAAMPSAALLPMLRFAAGGTPHPRVLAATLAERGLEPGAVDLLDALLALDPAQRLTAQAAQQHPWFHTDEQQQPQLQQQQQQQHEEAEGARERR